MFCSKFLFFFFSHTTKQIFFFFLLLLLLSIQRRKQEAERQRRKEGQSTSSVVEDMNKKIRKRQWAEAKKEKQRVQAERERLRRELAKDKAERKSRGGKLAGKLDADGYNPAGQNMNAQASAEAKEAAKRKAIAERRKILSEGGVKGFVEEVPKEDRLEKALTALGIQKARDSGKIALMTARKMLNRIVQNPKDPKYRSVNIENETIRRKVTSKPGGVNLLLASGFVKLDGKFVMEDANVDVVWIQSVIDQAGVVLAKLSQ